MVTAKVVTRSRFAEYGIECETAIRAAMTDALVVGRQAAADAETRVLTGTLHDSIWFKVVQEGSRWFGSIGSSVFYALFQESGTLSKRRRKLSPKTIARRDTPSGRARQANWKGAGITPLHFLLAGKRSWSELILERLKLSWPK